MKSLKDIDLRGNRISKGGFEVVNALPTTNLFAGREVVFKGLKYMYENSEQGWIRQRPLLDSYFKSGEINNYGNSFSSQKTMYISTIHDALYAADKRYNVSVVIYNSDDTIYTNVTNVSTLFNGSYETLLTIPAGKKCVITIEGHYIFNNLPYGNIWLQTYYGSREKSVSCRIYGNYASTGIGWFDLPMTQFNQYNTNTHQYRSDYNNRHLISIIELTVVAADDKPAILAAIEMALSRPNISDYPVLLKYGGIMYGDLQAPKFIKSGGTASQFLKANGDVDGTTYTPQTATGANNLISALPVWTQNPNDNTYIIRQDTGGSNTYGRVKASALWEYIKSKAGILYQPKGNYADGDEQGFLVKKPKISIAGGTTAGNDMFTFDGSDEFHLDLAKVAVSGSYNDLKDKPTIPQPQMVGSGVLTIMQGTVNKGMFSANATAGKTITLDAPETGATINGVQVSFAAQANNIPCYIDYNNVLYHCRISTDGTALQIFRNGVWADLIKSCSCNPKINETIEVDDLEAMKSAINEGYYSIEMTSNLTTEFINGKLQFSLGFAPSRNVTVATKPVSLKGIKVDTIKQQFQEFLNAGGRFFIENDLSAMISSGQTVCLQVTMQREPIPKVVVECYIEY